MCVSSSCTHCRASYWPFSLVIRPSNSSVEPEAAVASVMAGMGSDSAQGRQRRLTGMLLGWTKGLIVIHEFVSAAAPGLGAAAGRDGQGDTKWERWTIQLIVTLLMGCCYGEYEHLHMFFVWKKFLLIHILTSNHVVKFWGLDLFSGSRRGYISRLWLDLSVSPEQTQWSFWMRPLYDFLPSLPKPHRLMITLSSTMRQTHFKMSCKTCQLQRSSE